MCAIPVCEGWIANKEPKFESDNGPNYFLMTKKFK